MSLQEYSRPVFGSLRVIDPDAAREYRYAEHRKAMSELWKGRKFQPKKAGALVRYRTPIGPKPLRGGKHIYGSPIGPCLPWQRSVRHKSIWRKCYKMALRLPAPPRERPAFVDLNGVLPSELPKAIISNVARDYGFAVADILGKERGLRLCKARFAAVLAVKQAFPDYSTPRLGRLFKRDHSTIIHALRRARAA